MGRTANVRDASCGVIRAGVPIATTADDGSDRTTREAALGPPANPRGGPPAVSAGSPNGGSAAFELLIMAGCGMSCGRLARSAARPSAGVARLDADGVNAGRGGDTALKWLLSVSIFSS